MRELYIDEAENYSKKFKEVEFVEDNQSARGNDSSYRGYRARRGRGGGGGGGSKKK